MPEFDLPLDALRAYEPAVRCPDDFDDFWRDTLATSRDAGRSASWARVETGLRLVETYDLTISGFDGHTIRAWAHVSVGLPLPAPAAIEFLSYSAGRSHAWQGHTYAEAGYVHIVMDTRGQGRRGGGAAPDPTPESGQTLPGMMTRGIESASTYYYRRA